MKMTMEEANFLATIYNSLMKVNTSGESTMVMGDAIKNLQSFLAQIEIVENKENEVEEGA